MKNFVIWKNYSSKNVNGYLEWYFCDPKSIKHPIRDITTKNKFEPHYENKTFNFYKSCNQRFLKKALEDGISYIIFFTKYRGELVKFKNNYYITGYFKVGKTSLVNLIEPRYAVMASTQHFYKIQDALELKKIIGKDIQNARYAPKRLDKKQVRKILKYFNSKKNCVNEYVNFTKLQTTKSKHHF